MAVRGQCLSGAKRLNTEKHCMAINPRQAVVQTFWQPPHIWRLSRHPPFPPLSHQAVDADLNPS